MKKVIYNPNNKNILTIVDKETRKLISNMKRNGIFQNVVDSLNENKYKKIEDDLTRDDLEELVLRFLEGMFDRNMYSHKDYTEVSKFVEIKRTKIVKHFNSNNYTSVVELLKNYNIIETDGSYYSFDTVKKAMGYKLSENFVTNIHKENYKMNNRLSDINLKDFDTYTTSCDETYTTDLMRNSVSFDEQGVRNYLMNDVKISYKLVDLEEFETVVFDYLTGVDVECTITESDLKRLNKIGKNSKYILTAKSFESKIYFNKEQILYLLREQDLFDVECVENMLMIINGQYKIIVKSDMNKVNSIYKSCLVSNTTVNANRYNRLLRGSVYANVNCTNGRLDSNFTVLHKGIREFIKINKKEVFNIDIVNSQFTILANLLKGNLKHLVCKYTGYKFNYKSYSKFEDVQVFIKEAISGNFYEKVCEMVYEDAYIEATDKVKNILRNDMKITCYGILFSKPTYHRNNNENFVIFNEKFPNLVSILDSFQNFQNKFEEVKIDKNGKEDQKGALANTLCRLESDIMIKQLFRTKLENKKSVLMIHDGLYAPVTEKDSIITETHKIFKQNNLEVTLTLDGKIIKEDDLKPLYEIKKVKLADLSKKQKEAYKKLKKMEDLNGFMEQSKRMCTEYLGLSDTKEFTKFIAKVIK